MTKDILEILYIAAVAIGSFIGFCVTLWGVYWKVSQVRKKDLEKMDGDISKAKSAGENAANAVRKDMESQTEKLWIANRTSQKEAESELERKADQLHKRLEDEKRERHAEEVKQAREIGVLEGTVNTMMKLLVKNSD